MSFDVLVASRAEAWLRLAYLLTGDRQLAEDLLQTTLVEVYRRWRWVEHGAHPDAYVRRALVHTAISWRRRRSWWERPTASGLLPEAGGCFGGGPSPDPAEALAARDALWRLLHRLPPRARAVLVLRFFEDLDDAAIAELLGTAQGTVRATASRALATLRSELAATPAGDVL